MNLRELLEYLRAHGCQFARHGGSHDIWIDATGKKQTAVPRHRKIPKPTIRNICRQVGIPTPFKK